MRRCWPLLSLILVALTACEPRATAVPTVAPPVLRVYSWDTYIDPELLARFSREAGAASACTQRLCGH